MERRLTKQYKQKQVNKSPPRETTCDCNSKTNFTWYLCTIQVHMFVLDSLGLIDDTEHWGKRYQIWRLYSVSFVHGGLFHLLGNLIREVLVIGALEKIHGTRCVALVFIAGNAVGEFMKSLFSVNYEGELVSVGIMALLSLYMVHSIWNPSKRSKWLLILCFIQFVSDLLVLIAPHYVKRLCNRDTDICPELYSMGCIEPPHGSIHRLCVSQFRLALRHFEFRISSSDVSP